MRRVSAIGQGSWVSRLVDAACCVVGGNAGVTRITVVANRRLDYDELVRLRAHAQTCNADFVVGNGAVVVRRAAPAAAPQPATASHLEHPTPGPVGKSEEDNGHGIRDQDG